MSETSTALDLHEALNAIQSLAASRVINGKAVINYPANTRQALLFHLTHSEPIAPIDYHLMCIEVNDALRQLFGGTKTLSRGAQEYPFAKKK